MTCHLLCEGAIDFDFCNARQFVCKLILYRWQIGVSRKPWFVLICWIYQECTFLMFSSSITNSCTWLCSIYFCRRRSIPLLLGRSEKDCSSHCSTYNWSSLNYRCWWGRQTAKQYVSCLDVCISLMKKLRTSLVFTETTMRVIRERKRLG